MKINLGCGKDIREGWENYDKYPEDKRVKFIDLEKLPLPFKDSSVDEILIYGAYEHLRVNHYEFMNELSRILKKGGKLTIVVRGYRNIFDHERCLFNELYFEPAVSFYKMFRSVKSSYTFNTFRNCIETLKIMLLRVFVKEFKYEFKK